MRSLWADKYDLREACDNTLQVAERCEVTFSEGANYMPHFPVPAGESELTWFLKEVEAGLGRRYPEGIPPEARARADRETSVIAQMGFPGYFLVVADFINWAKAHRIRVGPGAVQRRARSSPTHWASRSWTRSSTGCCSSASSTLNGCRCLTSISTSTSAGAARSFAT